MPDQEINYDLIKYPKNFLTAVIFRLDFSTILSLSSSLPEKFQEKIRTQFPITELKNIIKLNNKIEHPKEVGNYQNIFNNYIFFTKDKTQQIEIAPTHLAIIFSKYSAFETFNETINDTFKIFNDLYSPLDLTRIGIRYINEIKLPHGHPLEWEDYINKNLILNLSAFEDIKENLNRNMAQMTFNFNDYFLIFNYGIFNQEFPGKISRKEFILDYDCYTNFIRIEDINNNLKIYHKQIQLLFESSIKDELRTSMEKI